MDNLLNIKNLTSYLESLKLKKDSEQDILNKLTSVEKFIKWAFTKGKIDENNFKQLENMIASSRLALTPPIALDSSPATPSAPIEEKRTHFFIRIPQTSMVMRIMGILLLIVVFGVSIVHNEFFKPNSSIKSQFIFPNSTRSLSVHAKLTDTVGNPINTKTDVTFNLYATAKDGASLYTGVCQGQQALTPDKDGFFSVIIGRDCGMKPIPNDLFLANPSIYLGISAGSDAEMLPRQQIANVGFAYTSETLQGFPLGSSDSSVPYINDQGDVLINSDNPTLAATAASANFTISSAKTLTLQSANSDVLGNGIILQATGSGSIKLRTGGTSDADTKLFIDSSVSGGNIGIGTLTPVYKLDIAAVNNGISARFVGKVKGDIATTSDEFVTLAQLQGGSGSLWLNGGTYSYPNPLLRKNIAIPLGSLSVGTTSGDFPFFVNGQMAGRALVNLNYTGTDQNILVASNSGTLKFAIGTGGNITSASGSKWQPTSNATNALNIANASGDIFVSFDTSNKRVGIGTSSPTGKLHVKASDSTSTTNYAGYIENGSTNTNTDGIDKYGLFLASTGSFSGSSGSATNNYGMYIATTSGADNNYDIYAQSGAYLSTGGTWTNASSRDLKTNFQNIDPNVILSKIEQLPMREWSYKTDNQNVIHLGPIAEDFYALFGLGNNNKSISTIDPAGVALAGIQALAYKVNDLSEKSAQYLRSSTDVINAFEANITDITASHKIVSPLVETTDLVATGTAQINHIVTNDIRPQQDTVTIDLNTDQQTSTSDPNIPKGKLAQLIIKGLENKTVASFDNSGNATLSGNLQARSVNTTTVDTQSLTSQQASISGTLIAHHIESDNIKNLENGYQNLQSDVHSNSTNNQQLSQQVSDIQKLLDDIKNQPLPSTEADQTFTDDAPINFSGKELIADTLSLTGSVNSFNGYFIDTLAAGNLQLKNDTLLSLTSELKLSALDDINLFEGKVVIARDGTITSEGAVIAKGGVKTNSLQGINPSDDINVRLLSQNNTKLNITNENGSVASIDASGSARFSKVETNNIDIGSKYLTSTASAVIAAADNLTRNGLYAPAIETTTQTAGEGIIPTDSNEVVIYNSSIQNDSLIYLTPTSTSLVKNLTLVEKEDCSTSAINTCKPYFKVAVDKPAGTSVSFNWLIIN